ncbi:uncharacterized protein [Amphiura filiformis]|uniref:uncharacterized protein n=1 Tax=Amphiura filiformis TaxID=82378 RepID=UPI003B20E3DB
MIIASYWDNTTVVDNSVQGEVNIIMNRKPLVIVVVTYLICNSIVFAQYSTKQDIICAMCLLSDGANNLLCESCPTRTQDDVGTFSIEQIPPSEHQRFRRLCTLLMVCDSPFAAQKRMTSKL